MKLLLLLMVFVAPMGANALSISLGGVELSLFRILFILSLLGLLLKGLLRKITVFTKETRYSVCFMLFWLLMAVISVLWAVDMVGYVRNLFFMFIGAISPILFLNYFKTIEDIKHAFLSFTLGALLQSLIGWYEIVFRRYHFVVLSDYLKEYYTQGADRIPIAMCGNPNDFATLMMFGSLVAIAGVMITRSRFGKLLCLGAFFNFALLIVMTTSRSNLLGWLLGVGALLLLSKRKKQILPVVVVLGLILSPIIVWVVTDYFQGKLAIGAGSDFVRLNLIKNGFVFLKKTFGLGVGTGQIEAWMRERAIYRTDGITNMHNWWMECLTAYGVVVFIGYLVYYVRLFWGFFKVANRCRQKTAKALAISLCAIMAGFIIASISSSSNITTEWLWTFWGVCIAYQGMIKNGELLPSAPAVERGTESSLCKNKKGA